MVFAETDTTMGIPAWVEDGSGYDKQYFAELRDLSRQH